MVNRRRMKYIILCEDKQQEVFTRRFLKRKGIGSREIKPVRSPSAHGSAENWVRINFVKELTTYRASTTSSALITVIDGDTIGVKGRIQQLKQECRNNAIPYKNENEAVMIAVPTRNIETWIHFLNGNDVGEIMVYPKLQRQSDCQFAVDRLVDICNKKDPVIGCPSLVAACDEYKLIY